MEYIGITEAHGLIALSRGAVGDFLSLANPVSYSEGVLHPIVRNSELLNLLNPSLVCDDSDRPGQ